MLNAQRHDLGRLPLARFLVYALPLLALTFCGPCPGQTYTIQTVAGGGLPENIAGLSASLGAVYGIAADQAGNVYIALADYSVVLRLDGSGRLTRVAGRGTAGFSGDGGPVTAAQLSNPRGLAVDSSGDLYIADAGNNRIRKVSGGMIDTVVGGGTSLGDDGPATSAQLKGPLDVAVDGSGNIYVADTGNHRIRLVTSGNIVTIAGNGTAGYTGDGGESPDAQLSSPTGVALSPAGKLYIVDYGNKCIRSIDAGHTIRTEASGLSSPRGVAVSGGGIVYIAEAGKNVVKQLSNGVLSVVAGTGQLGYNGDYHAAHQRQPDLAQRCGGRWLGKAPDCGHRGWPHPPSGAAAFGRRHGRGSTDYLHSGIPAEPRRDLRTEHRR
jgi:sugar lactone lactonase YvrE